MYPDGFELGYAGTAEPKKVRVRFFPENITTHNFQTNVTAKQVLANGPILVGQLLHGIGLTDRSDWAPHPREWWATEQVSGGIVYSPAHAADEIQYFANNAKFLEINWKTAEGTASQDPRHFGNSATKKEGEVAVAGLFFIINDSGIPVRCDKDGKLMNPDGTYVNPDDDPAKKKTVAADDTKEDPATETMTDKVKKWLRWALYAGIASLVVVGGYVGIKSLNKPAKKGK